MTPNNHALEHHVAGVDGILPRERPVFHTPARWEDVNMWRLRFWGLLIVSLCLAGAWVLAHLKDFLTT